MSQVDCEIFHEETIQKSCLGLPTFLHSDQSVAFVEGCDDQARFLEYRTFVGKLMGDLFLDGRQPLYDRFPDLLPDYLGGTYKIPSELLEPPFYDLNSQPNTNDEESEQAADSHAGNDA